MSRNQKITKLANAIRRYRGVSQPLEPGKPVQWITSPKIADRADVVRWLIELGLPVTASLETINGFTLVDQFDNWIRNV